MTQEDKQLLLANLSARLPYGVKIRIIHHEIKGADPEYVDDVFSTTYYNMIDYDDDNYEFLPYLRPISSMTEEEKKEYDNLYYNAPQFKDGWRDAKYLEGLHIDWLNKHHFDYHRLIEKGLALEAPEGMYKH